MLAIPENLFIVGWRNNFNLKIVTKNSVNQKSASPPVSIVLLYSFFFTFRFVWNSVVAVCTLLVNSRICYFQIFDAIIIASSFAIDLIFLGGVSGDEGQKAAAVLVILLLWRIARVVDGEKMYTIECYSNYYYDIFEKKKDENLSDEDP